MDFWDYTCRLFELYLAICWTNLSDYTYTCWAEAPIKIARMTLTIKRDGNWSSFQLANSAPPLSVTDSAIAPSARMALYFVNVDCETQSLHTSVFGACDP